MIARSVIWLGIVGLVACAHSAPVPRRDHILALADLNTASLAALDRQRTVIIFGNAPLEEHGPVLPIGSDTYQGDNIARRMAEHLADSLPGWSIVLMPKLWYGIDG